MILPHDYVNYVKLSFIDDNGLERTLYPVKETSRPSKTILQDSDSEYIYDNDDSLLLSTNSTAIDNFSGIETNAALGSSSADDYFAQNPTYSDSIIGFGRRYGSYARPPQSRPREIARAGTSRSSRRR